jgi:hypothetical protein
MAYGRLLLGIGVPFPAGCIVVPCLALCCLAYGQASYLEHEVHVHDLPSLTARSTEASDVLTASLEIVFNDKEVCCGKNSALEDSIQSCDPKSLKDIGSKLQGKHLFSDGRTFTVTAEYLTPDQVSAGHLISMLAANQAPLMLWNSHLYVVNGITYVKTIDNENGVGVAYTTHKFFLQDTRFSDSRREASFDRVTEDAGRVQGLLFLRAALQ